MLNKKLIAGSIFALMSAPALAIPSFSYTASSVSQEGSATLASVALPEVTITSGAEYSDDDLIVIDYNVALATGYVPASTLSMYAQCTDGTAAGGVVIDGDANDNGGELTLGLLSSNAAAGSVTYRVTDLSYAVTASGAAAAGVCVTSANSSVGAVLSLGTPLVDAAAARALGTVTGTYHATLPNGTTDIDGGLANLSFVTGAGAAAVTTSSMVNFLSQYVDAPVGALAGGNTGLSGTIDVTAAAPRSLFTDPDGAGVLTAGQTASGIITIAKTAGLVSPTADVSTTVTLYGDFSFLADEDATTAGVQNNAFIAGIAGGAAAAASSTITSSSMSWTFGTALAAVAAANVTISFDNGNNGDDGVVVAAGAGARAISDGAFTYDVSIAYTDGGTGGLGGATAVAGTSALTSGGALGAWGLNGSSTVISNYPLSSAVTQFVWVTNTGAQDGGIFATAIGGTGAQTMASCDLGVSSGAGEIIRITDELNTCLTDAGMTAGRAEITVTVNAAAASIGVYAGYKHDVDADRLNLTQ